MLLRRRDQLLGVWNRIRRRECRAGRVGSREDSITKDRNNPEIRPRGGLANGARCEDLGRRSQGEAHRRQGMVTCSAYTRERSAGFCVGQWVETESPHPSTDMMVLERRDVFHSMRIRDDELLLQVVPNEFLGHWNIHFGRPGSMGVRCAAEKIRTEHVRGE